MNINIKKRFKKKVLIIGGPDVHARIRLINQLKYDFSFECAGSDINIKDKFLDNDIKFYFYPLNLGLNIYRDLLSLVSLIRIIFKSSPDIVHTFDTKPNIYGRLAAKICNVKIIIGTQPGLGMVFSKYKPVFGSIGRLLFKMLVKLISSISSMTIYQNMSDLKFMRKEKVVYDKNSTTIISSGVDTNFYKNTKKNKVNTPLISEDSINIVFIARLTISKGTIFYCELAKQIRQDFPNVNFNIIGEIPQDSPDKVDEEIFIKYKDDINFLGKVSNTKKVLSEANLMVFPSFFTEGVPRVLLEAASMSLPIVAFDNPGSNEVVVDNFNGYLVPVGDMKLLEKSVLNLLKDENTYSKFCKNSRNLVEQRFKIEEVANQYKIEYKKLINRYLT